MVAFLCLLVDLPYDLNGLDVASSRERRTLS